MYKNEQVEIRKSQEELLKAIGKSVGKDDTPANSKWYNRYAKRVVWAVITAIFLIPVLLLGGGLKWIIGVSILAGVIVWVSDDDNDDNDDNGGGGGGGGGKRLVKALLMGAGGFGAGYALGKKLEI
jgi:hypothetical protein